MATMGKSVTCSVKREMTMVGTTLVGLTERYCVCLAGPNQGTTALQVSTDLGTVDGLKARNASILF